MPENSIILKVAGGSDPKEVGSSVAHHIAEGKDVQLRAIGAGSVNQAVKACAIARGWAAPRGYDLLFRPGFADVEGRQGGTISAITLTVVVSR